MQSIAQCGLTYAKDTYDIERYEQLRNISAEMLSYKAYIPVDKIKIYGKSLTTLSIIKWSLIVKKGMN